MKHKTVVCLISAVLFSMPLGIEAFTGVADVIETAGRVFVKHPGEKNWKQAEPFMILFENDELKTEKLSNSEVYFWPKNEAIKLGESAHIKLGKNNFNILSGQNVSVDSFGKIRKDKKEPSLVGATTLRGAAAAPSSLSQNFPALRARNFWMNGNFEEAAREYKQLLKSEKHKSRFLDEQLNLLKKEKAKRDALFDEAVNILAGRLKEKDKLKVCIGKITYADSDAAGSLGVFFSSELSRALVQSKAFREISRRELSRVMEEQKLSLTGVIEPSEAVVTGKIKGVNAILTGDYWEESLSIRANISLVNSLTAEKITAASFSIPLDLLPAELQSKPQNYDEYSSAVTAWKEHENGLGDFKVRVWVDDSSNTVAGLAGGVYKEGENITVFFKSDKDCYLRLFHTNAEGKIQLLFPNQYHRNDYIEKDKVYSIPDNDMPFQFKIAPPLGAEIIKAAASLQPFPKEESAGENSNNPFQFLGKAGQENIGGIVKRGITIIPAEARSEAICVFTTIAK